MMRRWWWVFLCAVARGLTAARVNCSVGVPGRVRGGDRVAVRVDVEVAEDESIFESLVVELRAPVRFRTEAPGLDPPPLDEDDVIFAVRRKEQAYVLRLGARRRRAIWASFVARDDGPPAFDVAASAALGTATAACRAPVAVVARRPPPDWARGCATVAVAAAEESLVVGETTTIRALAEGPLVVPLPFGVARVSGGRAVEGRHAVKLASRDDAAVVVATFPGYYAADPPRARSRGGACAIGETGVAVAVGTGRGAEGDLELGDVKHPDWPDRGEINPDDDQRGRR